MLSQWVSGSTHEIKIIDMIRKREVSDLLSIHSQSIIACAPALGIAPLVNYHSRKDLPLYSRLSTRVTEIQPLVSPGRG